MTQRNARKRTEKARVRFLDHRRRRVHRPAFGRRRAGLPLRKHAHVLSPERYVGAEAVEEDAEPFEEKMRRLAKTLREQQGEGAKLDAAIAENLKGLGFGG